MYEFDSVSVSSYEAASLAAKLTEKSGEGWDVVSIVPAGSEITAFLRRAGTGASAERAEAAETAGAPAAVTEPAGWATTPEPTPTAPTSPAATTVANARAQAVPTTPPTPTTPAVPAGWYDDPSGRNDLRYWDGTAWTEHVSRGGQQYTDPPVA